MLLLPPKHVCEDLELICDRTLVIGFDKDEYETEEAARRALTSATSILLWVRNGKEPTRTALVWLLEELDENRDAGTTDEGHAFWEALREFLSLPD